MEQRRLITASDQSTMNNHQDHGHHNYHPQNQQQPPNNSTRRVMKSQENTTAQTQPPAPQKCPRCESMNTKFCYYNNYSLSQPRYFCKACRRYWTHGGNLRNVPVGGGCRKSKRPKPSSSSSSTPSTNIDQISRTHIQSLAASSLPSSSSSTLPAFASQSFTGLLNPGGVHQNLIRVTTNPLTGGNNNNTTSMYPSSTVGGFFSSFGAVPQPIMPPQSGLASGTNQLFGGGNMAFFQGMNFQNLKPGQVSTYQPMIINPQGQSDHDDHHHEFVGSQFQQRPLNSWAQGFINNNNTSAGTSSTPSTSSFWISGSANVGNQSTQQAGTSSINPNQWSGSNDDDDKNQGFDPSR